MSQAVSQRQIHRQPAGYADDPALDVQADATERDRSRDRRYQQQLRD
jgi:hypothetical protein